MKLTSTLFGENDTHLPPKIVRSEDEQKLLEGRILRSTFAVAALAIVALYAADSFVKPTNSAGTVQRIAPSPLM